MKKYIGILSILSIFLMLTIGIATAQTNTTNMSKANGKVLYNYITKESNYKEWKMWPGKNALYPGKEPHGALLTTYVNDDAFSFIEKGMGDLPDESLIVKENYMPNKTLAAITVMYKEAGYDPDNNDWFWVKYTPNGSIDVEGKVKYCIDCHGIPKPDFNNQINDYIFTSNLQGAVMPTETIVGTIPPTTVPTIARTVEKTEVPSTPETTPKSPGFEGIIGIIGLILMVYLFRRKE